MQLWNKHFLCALMKTEARSLKTRDAVEDFHLLVHELSQTLPRFSPGYDGRENMFYFFYKIITFWLYKKKDDILNVFVQFCFFYESVNSYNLETVRYIAHVNSCFIALWKHTCSPIKTHVLSKLFYVVAIACCMHWMMKAVSLYEAWFKPKLFWNCFQFSIQHNFEKMLVLSSK